MRVKSLNPLYLLLQRRIQGITSFCERCGSLMVQRVLEGKNRLVCAACKSVRYPDIVAAVSAIVYDAGDRILLVQRAIHPGYGRWVIPGGYAEGGEPLDRAAVREVEEEAHLQVGEAVLSGVYSTPDARVATIVYAMRAVHDDRIKAGSESLRARWFPFHEIPWGEVYFESTRRAIRDWIKRGSQTRTDRSTNRDPE